MIGLRMAVRSLLQSRGLTATMVVALSLGIATWYVQHQIFAFLDGKTPDAPDDLYQVSIHRARAARAIDRAPLDPRAIERVVPAILLTPRDAEHVISAAGPHRIAVTFSAPGLVEPADQPAETALVRYATRDLFELFAIPFVEGAAWSRSDEAVIDERLARRLFDTAPAVGQQLRVDGANLRIAGVVAASYTDRYRLFERFVSGIDGVYLPLAQATAARAQPHFAHRVAGEAAYENAWIELAGEADRTAFVAATSARLGRPVTLRSASEWREAYAPGGAINTWPMFAAMCVATSVLNLVRMLMAKFIGRGHDLGLMRAFGARRRAVMGQLLLEAMLIGVAAGAAGIVLGIAIMPLAASTVANTPGSPSTISGGAILATLAATTTAALLAAIYPAWRLSRGTPASLLRSR